MSGNVSDASFDKEYEAELVKDMIQKLGIDKKTALVIVDYYTIREQERMKKLYNAVRKNQKNKADVIYGLLKRLKRGDSTVIYNIETLILELCIGDY